MTTIAACLLENRQPIIRTYYTLFHDRVHGEFPAEDFQMRLRLRDYAIEINFWWRLINMALARTVHSSLGTYIVWPASSAASGAVSQRANTGKPRKLISFRRNLMVLFGLIELNNFATISFNVTSVIRTWIIGYGCTVLLDIAFCRYAIDIFEWQLFGSTEIKETNSVRMYRAAKSPEYYEQGETRLRW